MPWKWIVCGCVPALMKWMRNRSPSRARNVGPRHAAVVGPGGILDARHDLDLLVGCDELPFAERAAAGQSPRLAPVEVAQDQRRVEAVDLRIDGCVAFGKAGVRRAVGQWVVLMYRSSGIAQPGGYSCPDHGCRGGECAAPGEGPAQHLAETLAPSPKRNLKPALRLLEDYAA